MDYESDVYAPLTFNCSFCHPETKMKKKDANEIANSVAPDQTASHEHSDLGLHCLPRHICPKTYDQYSRQKQ